MYRYHSWIEASSREWNHGSCRVVETMLERYKGDDGDPWHNNPIYMTGPAVLNYTVQKYFKMPYPVSGFLGKVYNVSVLPRGPPSPS